MRGDGLNVTNIVSGQTAGVALQPLSDRHFHMYATAPMPPVHI